MITSLLVPQSAFCRSNGGNSFRINFSAVWLAPGPSNKLAVPSVPTEVSGRVRLAGKADKRDVLALGMRFCESAPS
jgi:hypothetical protein